MTTTHPTHPTDPTDPTAAALGGDRAAWTQLVLRYEGLVRATARRHRLQPQDVEDVCQTTWLRLLEQGARVREPERLAGWLVTTASRECLRLLAAGRREPAVDVQDWPVSGVDQPEPPDRLLEQELHRAVRDAVGALPPRWSQLLLALAADERPGYDRVARELHLPVGSIGPTRARALRRSRELLAAQRYVA